MLRIVFSRWRITPPLAGERVLRWECLSVCLSVRSPISGTIWPNLTKFICMLPMAVARSFSGDVLDTLCASGFVGDGVLAHNHPDKGVFSNRLTRGITEPGRSLMSTKPCWWWLKFPSNSAYRFCQADGPTPPTAFLQLLQPTRFILASK